MTRRGGLDPLQAENGAALIGIDHVQLAMPPGGECLARRFWSDALGLTEVAKPPSLAARGGCWFEGAGVAVHVGVERDFRPARKAHPAFLVADLSALAARLKAEGLSVDEDLPMPGCERRYVSDPFGNRIELIQRGGSTMP